MTMKVLMCWFVVMCIKGRESFLVEVKIQRPFGISQHST